MQRVSPKLKWAARPDILPTENREKIRTELVEVCRRQTLVQGPNLVVLYQEQLKRACVQAGDETTARDDRHGKRLSFLGTEWDASSYTEQ